MGRTFKDSPSKKFERSENKKNKFKKPSKFIQKEKNNFNEVWKKEL